MAARWSSGAVTSDPGRCPGQGEHQIEVDTQHVGEQIAGARAGLTLAGHPAADGAAGHLQAPRQLGGVPTPAPQLPAQPLDEPLVPPPSCFHLEIIVDNNSSWHYFDSIRNRR